jgi:hypothetical protein
MPVKLPPAWPISRIATEYHGGKTLNQLSAETGASRSTLSRMLKAYGSEVRGRGTYPRPRTPSGTVMAEPVSASESVIDLE